MDPVAPDRSLSVKEAYDALDAFGRHAGRVPLLLLLHAAVPQSFRADLLNLLKVNFLSAEAGIDMTVDADVLLSGLVQPAAAGYYRLDPEVRRHCLELLDAAYRGQKQRRSVEVAWFLLAYADALERQAALALDALMSEYLAIQRWVAVAFIDPASAAAAFARAISGAVDGAAPVAALRLGSVTAAITIPLAGQEGLLAYARGIDALAQGDGERARRLLDWTRDDELQVGDVTLRSGREALTRFGLASQPRPVPTTAAATTAPASVPAPIHVNVPPRTVTMVGRQEELTRARDLLLGDSSPTAGRLTIVDIKGVPGVGKWTLANALVHDPAIVASFSDGIVWLNEEETEYPTRAIEEYGKAIGAGDLIDDERRVRHERFRSVFADRRVLVVTYTRTSDIEPVLIALLGPRCALLRVASKVEVTSPVPTIVVSPLDPTGVAVLLGRPAPPQGSTESTDPALVTDVAVWAIQGNPLLARLLAPTLDTAMADSQLKGSEHSARAFLSMTWPRLRAQSQMVLEMIAERMPAYRTWFAKSELDDGLSPPVGQMLDGAPVDILGEYVRIHPLVRAALPEVIARARLGQAPQRTDDDQNGRRDVFIWYAPEDGFVALQIMDALSALGLSFVTNQQAEDTPPVERILARLERLITRAILLMPVLSRALTTTRTTSFGAVWETVIGIARGRQGQPVPILPVVIDNLEPSALRASLASMGLIDIQWVHAPGGRVSEEFVRAVRNAQGKSREGASDADRERDNFVIAIGNGDSRRVGDDLLGAMGSYDEAYAIATRRVQADPADAAWQHGLASAARRLVEVFEKRGQFDEARAVYEAAIEAGHRLESDASSATWLRDLWSLRLGLGRVHVMTARLDAALQQHQEALEIAERLATLEPGNRSQQNLWVSETNVASVRQRMGDVTGALEHFQRAHGLAEHLAATDPGSRNAQLDLWASTINFGLVQNAVGDFTKALSLFKTACAIAETYLIHDPTDRHWIENLAQTWKYVGDVHRALGRTAEADRADEQARAITDRLDGAKERQAPGDERLQDFAIVIDMDVAGDPRRQQMMEDAGAPSIRSWLSDPGGGNVPSDRLAVATERSYAHLAQLFNRLVSEVDRVRANGEPTRFNRRLYVYVLGQVSTSPAGDALLLVSDESPQFRTINIADYVRRAAAAGGFFELVLWVDGLAERFDVPPEVVRLPAVPATGVPRFFTAVSIHDGQSRSPRLSFVLLEGFRGAARDRSTGQVTSESLSRFIMSSMPASEGRQQPTIGTQGSIVFVDSSQARR